LQQANRFVRATLRALQAFEKYAKSEKNRLKSGKILPLLFGSEGMPKRRILTNSGF